MLSTYLFGLVIGRLGVREISGARKDQLLRYFAITQFLIAVAATLTLAITRQGRYVSLILVPDRRQRCANPSTDAVGR